MPIQGKSDVTFTASDQRFQSVGNRVLKTTSRIADRMESAGRAAQRFLLIGGAAAAGFAALAAKQEQAERGVEGALRATGQEVEKNSRLLRKQASEIQKVTRFGDEFVLQLQAMAINLGASSDEATEWVKAAIGMAAALGERLNPTLIRYIALAKMGDFTMLRRYIPALRSTTDAQKQLAIFLDFTNKGFKQEIELARTAAGQLKQARDVLGDIGEELGNAVLPALNQFSTFIKANGDEIQKWIRTNQVAIQTDVELTTKTLALVVALGLGAKAWRKFVAAIKAGTILQLVGPQISSLALLTRASAAFAIGAGLAYLIRSREIRIAQRQMAQAMGESSRAVAGLNEKLAAITSAENAEQRLIALRDALAAFRREFETFSQLTEGAQNEGLKSALGEVLGKLTSGLGATGRTFALETIKRLQELAGAERELRTDTVEAAETIDEQVAAVKRLLSVVTEMDQLLKGLEQAGFADAFDIEQFQIAASGVDALAAALGRLAAKQKTATDRTREFVLALLDETLAGLEAERQANRAAELKKRLEEGRKERKERIQEAKDSFADQLELFGVSGEDRQRITLERQRKDLIDWARKLGLGADIIADINERFQASIAGLAEGTKEVNRGLGTFQSGPQLFRSIQRMVTLQDAARKATNAAQADQAGGKKGGKGKSADEAAKDRTDRDTERNTGETAGHTKTIIGAIEQTNRLLDGHFVAVFA